MKQEKKLRLGFIGGGINSIAGYPHFIAAQMDQKFEVVGGIFSSDMENNNKASEKYNVPAFSNIEEMFDNIDLDAVSVLTPTNIHYENIIALSEKNCNVICEKPIVSSYDDAKKIAMIQNKPLITTTYNYTGYPMIRELRALLLGGTLGKILKINLEMPQESFLRPPKSHLYPQKWRLNDDFIPSINLDLGVHLHNLAYFLTDDMPRNIFANMANFSKYKVIDDTNIFMKHDSEVLTHLWISKIALGNRNGLKVNIYGSEGSAQWIQENPENLQICLTNGEKINIDRGSNCLVANEKRYNRMTPGHPGGYLEAFANVYFDIASHLMDKKSSQESNNYVDNLDYSIESIKALHCASLSNEHKRWVSIDEID